MQVYVLKSDLSSQAAVVMVQGSYPDQPQLDRNLLGTQFTVLTLPPTSVVPYAVPGTSPALLMSQLESGWRNNASMIVRNEAQRRILESFSEFMQRNATNDATQSLMLYGPDPAAWPQDAKDRKAAAEVGWDYVATVRQTSDALETALPPDPTADGHWPTRIPPVYIG